MSKDYKESLNLPKTSFPMKANLPQREPEMLKFWQKMDLYKKCLQNRENDDKYILHDGPPYANGKLHMGHALNKILKDIVIKSRAMSGFNTPYVPGWDCHGLPIEINVEKKVGKAGGKISKEEFIQACRKYAGQQIEIQREGFMRLEVTGDWYNPYLTMDYHYEADVIRALGKIIENGHLTHGFKPVHWCTDCGSALAEAEVEYQDKTSPAIDVRFNVINKNELLSRFNINKSSDKNISIPIWTTTPWTLPANQAVALHPEFEYELVKTPNEYLVIAKDLLEQTLQRYGIGKFTIIATTVGENLENIAVQHPFLDKQVPVILGHHVTTEAGTGAVHTAPGHGQEDYVIGCQYGLPIENPVDNNGCFLQNTEYFAGEHVLKANDHVIEVLDQHGTLLHHENIQHNYPHCWRHKIPVIFRATPQWFISMDKSGLRQKALLEIDRVKWLPKWGHARIKSMVEKRPDWCISRQRVWGTPMPLFINKENKELHPETLKIIEQVAKKVEQNGVEAWWKLTVEELLGKEAQNYEKVTDTLDVWFDSGVTHYCVLAKRPELSWPADLYLEGSDQHRGWFQSSLLTAVAMYGSAPFNTVVTHGHVLDGQGRKMSKSVGNVIDPEKIEKQLGADIIRLWVSGTDYSSDIYCSDESVKRATDTYRRLRNTAKFLLSNLHNFDASKNMIAANEMLALDRWAVDRARIMQQEIRQHYDDFQFHLVYQKLHNFCTVDMGSFYLDIIKDRQYTMKTDSHGRRSAQSAIYHILQALVRWLAPILSFTSEEIWQLLPDKPEETVFLATWYENLESIANTEPMNQTYWQQLMQIRDEVNRNLEKQRAAGEIGSALGADVMLYCNEQLTQQLKLLGDELRFVFITASAQVFPQTERTNDAVETAIDGLWIKTQPSPYTKCIRCWHYRHDVGIDPEHPEICGRCVENVVGNGEKRLFA